MTDALTRTDGQSGLSGHAKLDRLVNEIHLSFVWLLDAVFFTDSRLPSEPPYPYLFLPPPPTHTHTYTH